MERIKTVDLVVSNLCEEIDYWKSRTKEAEKDAKFWRDECSKNLSESLEMSKKGVAQALMFALHATDDANGNLVINKESRKKIAETFKG